MVGVTTFGFTNVFHEAGNVDPRGELVDLGLLRETVRAHDGPVASLGRFVQKMMIRAGLRELVDFYPLSHPSPRNRRINDPENIAADLLMFYGWCRSLDEIRRRYA